MRNIYRNSVWFGFVLFMTVGCTPEKAPECVSGSEKCETGVLSGHDIWYMCDGEGKWLPIQSCTQCQGNHCEDPVMDWQCEEEGKTSCLDASSVSIQFTCIQNRLIPTVCGANQSCDGDRCSNVQSNCSDGETHCIWVESMNLAVQSVCVEQQWIGFYCGENYTCGGDLCVIKSDSTKDEQNEENQNSGNQNDENQNSGNQGGKVVICTKKGEVPDSQGKCVCDDKQNLTRNNLGKCVCKEDYHEVKGKCITCEENQIWNEGTSSCEERVEVLNCVDVKNPAFGDLCTFGRYMTDREGKNISDLVWKIIDVQDDRLMLITENCIDSQQYNKEYGYPITWEQSTIRSWLNGFGSELNYHQVDYSEDNFIKIAFNDVELEKILWTTNTNPDNPRASNIPQPGGNDTQDRIFFLSEDELKHYFPDYQDRYYITASDRVFTAANYSAVTKDGRKVVHWWLRSPGTMQGTATIVQYSGMLTSNRMDSLLGIRPVLWLKR